MKDVITLSQLDQVHALSDPLRMQIIHALRQEALTATQLALVLGEKASRLYYHVDALASLGLIELVQTRPKRGTFEKYYRAAARAFLISHDLLIGETGTSDHERGMQELIFNLLETTRTELTRTLLQQRLHPDEEGLPGVFAHGSICATPEKIAELSSQLHAWIEACQGSLPEEGRTVQFSFTVAFYPRVSAIPEETYEPGPSEHF